MNMQERYDDIAKRTGLSETIVRRVLGATRDSVVASLKQGDSATLPGICSIKPEFVRPFNLVTGERKDEGFVRASIKLSQALREDLKQTIVSDEQMKKRDEALDKLNYVGDNQDGPKIRTRQLNSLL